MIFKIINFMLNKTLKKYSFIFPDFVLDFQFMFSIL